MGLFLVIIITFILLFIKIILSNNTRIELFNNNNLYENIFETNIFDNKNICLIANNPNITQATIDYVNKNFNTPEYLVIRMGGDRLNLEPKILPGKNDIMIYRANGFNFNGFNDNYKKYNICVFTLWDGDKPPKHTQFTKKGKYYIFNKKRYYNKIKHINKNKKIYISIISGKYINNHSPTQGFGTLINLVENTKYKNIYLIGFTHLINNHTKRIYHYLNLERQYYEQNLKNLHNIKILP